MDLNKLNKYRNRAEFVEDLKRKAYETEVKYHGCAQATLKPFLDIFEINDPSVMMAASPFAGGLALTGHNCGALTGGLIVLGLVFGRRDITEGMEGILTGLRPMRKLVRYFEGKQGTVDCREITRTDVADPVKSAEYFDHGGLERCAHLIAEVAGFVGEILYEEKITREGI
jgi:C_GCAxxG_C_C family probable redox protein